MVVKLKDAKIEVSVDLRTSEKEVESLEKRTTRQREDQEKAERKSRKAERDAKKSGGSTVKGILGAGLYQTVVGIIRGIPIFELIAAGAGVAELREKFGPFAEGLFEEIITKRFGIPPESLSLIGGIPPETWAKIKAFFTSFQAGYEQALAIGAADVLTGGTFTAQEFVDVFGVEKEYAYYETLRRKALQRAKQRAAGAGVGRSAEEAVKKLLEGAPIFR